MNAVALNLAEQDPTMWVICSRMQEGYARGDEEPNRVHAAIQGGAIKAAHGIGQLKASVELGVIDVLDEIDGDSAAAYIGACAVGGQLECIENKFVNVLPRSGLIAVRNIFKNCGILNLSVPDTMIAQELNMAKVLHPRPDQLVLGYGYTDLSSMKPVFRYSSDPDLTPEKLRQELAWGAHMPLAGGVAPRRSDGRRCADAGVSMITRDISLNGGATHILELANSPKHNRPFNPTKTRVVGAWINLNGGNAKDYWRYIKRQTMEHNAPDPANVTVIHPTEGAVLAGTLCKKPKIIKDTVDDGYKVFIEAFGYGDAATDVARARLQYFAGYGAMARTFALAS